ncbi:DNA methyltransferase [Solwaraspora sp. WMMD1047]|uniref:TRM11 family SAM-dependent methyltransferase n=1 Tax=Solwaraspora sp. WMMD1047 TaxID=3016102 RepID=UPI0024162BCA|nr:DNA methyltransferase [Solwaraspora sp. WMMD1047]MDG4834825.1 DNA methyltransferase [Solwaraspora sp. WMMD1047]
MADQLPVTSVWLTCQRPARDQRRGRYVEETSRHPAKMLPDLAAHAINAYTAPGDLVLDPMCGSGTTLVEAVRSGRDGIGVDIEATFVALAQANLALAAEHGHTSWGQVACGDARNVAALLPASSHGKVSLVVTSPPYGRKTHGLVRTKPGERVHKRDHLYGDRGAGNLAYVGWDRLLAGWRQIVAGCVEMLRPGGTFVFTGRPVRRTPDDLFDLPGELFTAALSVGLEPVERCVAMLAAVRDGQLVHRANMFGLMAVRKARADGIPVALVAHEDVYVLRRPLLPAPVRHRTRSGAARQSLPTPR